MHTTVHPSHRETIWSLFLPILGGLLTAQLIATCFVYNANMRLYDKVLAATKAGYFVIPAGPVTDTLTTLKSAVLGGLFYTLSIGVGLTLISWTAIMVWQIMPKRNRWVPGCYLLTWLGLLLWINQKGFTLYPTLFCLFVPLATALILLRGTATYRPGPISLRIVPCAALVLLTAIWATQLDRHLFTAIRDHVLLTNPVGRSVNDFYYRYTLYAAESFKSLMQLNMRSYHIEPVDDHRLVQNISQRLAHFDMLYLPKVEHPDFMVTVEKDRILLTAAGGKQIESTLKAVLANPGQWLQQLSNKTDLHAPLRRITLIGLLVGFPILLYLLVYGLLKIAAGTVLQQKGATFAASGLSLLIGLLLFVPMLGNRPVTITEQNLAQELTSEKWPHRVEALRFIEKGKVDLGHYPRYKAMLQSPLVVERYYVARALAKSRLPATYDDLKTMLDDGHPIVTCQVFYALGRRGRREAIAPILSKMATGDHWYAQWYGYRALRRLGWYPSP